MFCLLNVLCSPSCPSTHNETSLAQKPESSKIFLLFQSKAFHFVYKKKVYPVEMKSLRVERKLQWCLVQKKTEIRGNKANFKPLTLGLPVPSSFSADTSVASISALMISRALRIQLCCRLICLCSSFHWLEIICSMSFSPSPKRRGKN